MPKKAANAVNEFDDAAWNAAFSQMTEDRKEDDAGSIATKDAMAVVDKIFDDMKTRYFGHLDVMETSVEQFGKDVATVDEQLNKIKEQLGAPAEGVPPS